MPSNTAFSERRQHLMAQMQPNSIAIIASASEQIRNNDVEFSFRQDSSFYYLTGFDEPDCLLVLCPGAEQESILFVRPRDKQMEIWHGYRQGPEGAVANFAFDTADSIEHIDEAMPKLLANKTVIYAHLGQDNEFDQQIMQWLNQVRSQVRNGINAPNSLMDISELINEMRLLKSEYEISQMRQACQISAQAHQRAMQQCQVGMYEYQLDAHIQFHSNMAGSPRNAYNSIVASGNNACILHYTENNQVIKDGELILIDAGCEYNYYAADITRCFPANGKFSPEQAQLYQIVLDAQKAAIKQVKPGNSFDDPHQAAIRVLTQGLMDINILDGELEQLIADEAYRPFYMHKTGHWIGMDVHDVGAYKLQGQWRSLQAGHCLTIEPGLYIAADNELAPAQYRGIGIRIEDDVLVTQQGCEVLSAGVVKEIDEIEALMLEVS